MSELPRGWCIVQIQDIADVGTGATPKRGTKEFYESGTIPWITSGAVSQGLITHAEEFITEAAIRATNCKVFPSGTIVMAMYGEGKTRGSVAELAIEAATNQALAAIVLRQNGAVSGKYLTSFLTSQYSQLRGLAAGGVQPNLNLQSVKNTSLPLPTLAEQKRIVAKLDALDAKSARARTELARIETLVSRYKQAVLSKAFSGELTREWPMVSLDLLSKAVFDGPFGSNLKSSDYTEEGPRVVRLENIGAREFIEEKRTHISEEKFLSLARHTLKANDLLFSSFVSEEIRACLFPANTNFKAINKADCFCIRLDTAKIDPQFALFQLTSETTYRHFVQQVHGATRPRINLSQLKNYPLLVPTVEEQHEIVRRIESAFARIDRLAREAKRALELVGKLDEAILAKAFRGELVPQDEGDEPAEKLLERIRAERAAAPKAKRGRK
jgi:type I restriction enzyme, S subunit